MMKIFDELNNKNFRLFAANNYNNPECTDVEEFKQDINRFKYLKRLLTRYDEHGELQERLILNHLIVLYNVFGIEAGHKMVMYKIHENHHHIIKPFLEMHTELINLCFLPLSFFKIVKASSLLSGLDINSLSKSITLSAPKTNLSL